MPDMPCQAWQPRGWPAVFGCGATRVPGAYGRTYVRTYVLEYRWLVAHDECFVSMQLLG
jgi:hypothetical protein